ncbi:Esterase FE4 [Armadillidium vulgare]|nr:Esterase FE4 [Armadillidium vulgare]
MKMKFFFVVAVLGFLTVTEARFPKFRLSNRRIEDPEEAAQINSKFEAAIDEKWRKHTKVEATDDTDPPVDQGKYWDDDIFNATHIGLKCPQGAYVGDEPGGDEDCLFLNVYTPYKPTTTEAKDLAVMFFIYGGSFTSGDSSLYMPTKLLDHDVILVTTHYRLGAFGFYTRDSADAPGSKLHLGLWWQPGIGNHIWRKCWIRLSQLHDALWITGDLFRGVIAESGSALDHWAFDEDSSYATNYYEHYVGCDVRETEEEILECMRNVPFQDLIHAGHAMVREDRKHGLIGFRGCSPTMQTFNDSGLDFKRILYQHPRDYFINRDFHDAAFMTGSNREEGSFVAGIKLVLFRKMKEF